MADASDSKSDVGDHVWVQVPSPALFFCQNADDPSERNPRDFFVILHSVKI